MGVVVIFDFLVGVDDDWVCEMLVMLCKCLLLMLVVMLELVCCGCKFSLVDDLCLECDFVYYVFYLWGVVCSEMVEGICVLVVDKDYVLCW